MANIAQQKPCLVPTTQGFSVSYKEKLLYSKYNPSKTILKTIENINILPGTIILCCSPVLDYGIEELYKKLPENCVLFGCEPDDVLREFSISQIKNRDYLIFLNSNEFYDFPIIINKKKYTFESGKTIEFAGNFQRILRIDFSAAVQFNFELFNNFELLTSNAIKTFWTNRITLTHFGRRYSQNLFRNLNNISETIAIESFFNSISKPIIVCGAGQSLNSAPLDFIQNRNNYFILCADTALKPLLAQNITPDGVFLDEAQHVISKAFLGTQNLNYHLFASLCSLPQIGTMLPKNRISYYTTLYTQSDFITKQVNSGIFPFATNPFGSVGLTAVYFALKFRKDTSIPIFLYGLDFSYSLGFTHARQTIAHENRLLQNSRLFPCQNYEASFCGAAFKIKDKNHNVFFTTPILESYGNLFKSYFGTQQNLYDSGECGINLSLLQKKPILCDYIKSSETTYSKISKQKLESIIQYLKNEKEQLLILKDILTGVKKIPQQEIETTIKKILQEREYLYLHFPDGFKITYNQSFLNRIRTEIDFFLKFM